MTASHPRFKSDDRPLWEPSREEFERLVYSPEILRELMWAPVIVEDFDVPDLGGSSINPGLVKIFIDQSLAKKKPTLKRTKLPYEYWRSSIALHEQIENILHRKFKMPYDVPGGPSAHGFATILEHQYVKEKFGINPEAYEEDLSAFVAETEIEHIKKPPLDLACFPYYDAPDARDLRILKRLAQLGVVDAKPAGEFHPMKIGARQAPDGKWYVRDHARPGKFLRVKHGGSSARAGGT